MKTLFIDIADKPIENTDSIVCLSFSENLLNAFFYEIGCCLLSQSGIDLPKAKLISEFALSGYESEYDKIIAQWNELKSILFGEDVNGTFTVHLPKEYLVWLCNHPNQNYRTVYKNKNLDCTRELSIIIDVKDFYEEYVNDDLTRSLLSAIKKDEDLEEIVFNLNAVSRKSNIVKRLREDCSGISFTPYELWSNDSNEDVKTGEKPTIDNLIIAQYQDSDYPYTEHYIDANGTEQNFQWGCFYWKDDQSHKHLYKKEGDRVIDLGVNDDIKRIGKLLIVHNYDEAPFSAYTEDGSLHKISGKYILEDFLHSGYLTICGVSRGKYAVVNLIDSTVLQKFDSSYNVYDNKNCYYISDNFLLSSDYHTLYFVIHDDDADEEHIEYFNVLTGEKGVVDVYFHCNIERYHKHISLEGASDDYFVFSNADSYKTGEEKIVYNLYGGIEHVFYKYWPDVWDKIVYSSTGGMFNCRSGISNENCTPDFRINEYLSVTEKERYEKNGRQVTSYNHKLINYETEDLILEGEASIVFSTSNKIHLLAISDKEDYILYNLETKETIEIGLPWYYADILFTETDNFINISANEYDLNDVDFNHSKHYSIVLNKDFSVICEDVWGKYISVCGMEDGCIYYLKSSGEYGKLINGQENEINKIVLHRSTYRMQPVYKENKFLVWSKNNVLLINSSGKVEADICLKRIEKWLDLEERIYEFKKVILSFSSCMGILYEDHTGIVCDFRTGNVLPISNCSKIDVPEIKVWENLIIYDGKYNGEKLAFSKGIENE